MVKSILFGGQAGQGPNILSHIISEAMVKQGYHVFYSRDYESLIRGGHNFNVVSFSRSQIHSNESKVDLIIALDEKTQKIHRKDLKKKGIILGGLHDNIYFAGALFKILGLDFRILEQQLKKLKNFEENLRSARKGYGAEKRNIKINSIPSAGKKENFELKNGSQGIAEGAVKSGLDLYYAYPMTPATPVLFELASMQKENNFLVLELESEVSVINAALGSSATGAKAMVGTSGGGFDLMTESLSMSGMAEIPIVIYLASRPGPGTGVATYTSQGDLNLARNSGHGEFSRVVLAPGDPIECQELTSQAFYFSQKFKIPTMVLSDKHLSESFYTLSHDPEITPSEKSTRLIRYNSYEHIETGEATEKAEIIKKNFERRMKKQKDIGKEAEKFKRYKTFGKNSKNIILGWGSTKGAIIDSIKDLNCKFLQVLYMEPFPDIKKEIEGKNILIVENNSTSQLSQLIAEKTGIIIKEENKILRYDGRPFLSDELNVEISKRLK
jgi:2-oxoglutarate/2-oxoacid ferredoxin oxidoreductase subunit alpha